MTDETKPPAVGVPLHEPVGPLPEANGFKGREFASRIPWTWPAWLMTFAALITILGVFLGDTPWIAAWNAAAAAWFSWMVVHVDNLKRPNARLSG